jgi:hypothetical protein
VIRRRFAERIKQQDWFAVGVDLLVVVVGILLALQVDNWAQGRSDRLLELVYLQHLKEDMEIERSRMEAAQDNAERRIEAARLLSQLLSAPDLAADAPSRVPWAIETASWRSFPRINAYVYGELQNSGRLVLIRSDSLRRSLAEHYTALQHDARVGEDLSAQQRFEGGTAGLLTVEELETLEQAAGDLEQLRTTPERALTLARLLSQRAAAVAELPSLVQHHTFNLRVIAQMRERSDAIIRQIDTQLQR